MTSSRHISRSFVALALLCVSVSKVMAEDWPLADPALKACVEKNAAKEGWRKVEDVTNLRCHSMNIVKLAGLEAFSNLQSLSLHNNDIESISTDYWPKLQNLNIAKNKLSQLTIKNLPEIQNVYAFGNQIENLVLADLPALEQIKANNNGMKTFSYQNLPGVTKIYLFDNKLETMDIHHLPAIKYMDVRQNPMPDELYEDMDELIGVTVLHDGNAEDWQ